MPKASVSGGCCVPAPPPAQSLAQPCCPTGPGQEQSRGQAPPPSPRGPTTKSQGPRHAPAPKTLDHIPPQSCYLSSTSKTATETLRPERRGAILMPHQQSLPVCLLLLLRRGPGETPAQSRGHGRKTPGSYPLSSTASTQSSKGLLGMIQLPLHAQCDALLPPW